MEGQNTADVSDTDTDVDTDASSPRIPDSQEPFVLKSRGGAPAPSATAVAAAAGGSSTSFPRDLVTRPAPEEAQGDTRESKRAKVTQKPLSAKEKAAQEFADAAEKWKLTLYQPPNSDDYYCMNSGSSNQLFVIHEYNPFIMYELNPGDPPLAVFPHDKIRFGTKDLELTREAADLIKK